MRRLAVFGAVRARGVREKEQHVRGENGWPRSTPADEVTLARDRRPAAQGGAGVQLMSR
jgi:hypothetical protein